MEYSYDVVLNKLLSEIPLNPSDKVYGITFVAGPGFGKSTVANMLSKKLGLYITANDKIRRLVDDLGFDNKEHEADIKKMANDRTIYLLQNKTSHIIDADMEFYWEMARDNYNKYNAKLIFVELKCSEKEVLRRIEERAKEFGNSSNLSRATKEDYYIYLEKKKNKQIPDDMIFYTINTETSIEDINNQVDLLIEKIKEII